MASASAIFATFKPWLLRYRGGMPAGFLAKIIEHESSGNPNATGDASLGEKGLLQLESSLPAKVGLPGVDLFNPELNIFLGSLEYQLRAVEMRAYAPLGSADSWRLARLAFAVGTSGTKRLIEAAGSGSFDRIRAWANQTGAMALSSGQPAEKVLARINAVQDQWVAGQAISGSYGAPEKISAPKGLTYRIPAALAPYLASPLTGTLVALGALGVLGLYLYFRKDGTDAPTEHPTPA